MRISLLFATSLFVLSSAASGQEGPAECHDARPRDSHRLLVDQAEDGTIWALGDDYKLSLDRGGARFRVRVDPRQRAHVLWLGPVAAFAGERELPVAADIAPQVHGPEVYFDRGALVEVWQLAPEGARQNFLLVEPPPVGELRLRQAVGGDLCHVPTDGPLTFTAADGARVIYGDWLAYDAKGMSCHGRPVFLDGAIELRLPAEFLAGATYPLWIDPLVSSAVLLTTTHDIRSIDIAVDDSLGVLMSVHSETFAAGDEDIVARRYSTTGSFLTESAIDISDQASKSPAVANHERANQFLVVWEQLPTQPYQIARILGRTHTASGTSMGSIFTINLGDSAGFPDVGGPSSNSLLAPYYVVWREIALVPFNGNIAGRTVTPSGDKGSKSVLDNRTSEQGNPSISKRSGNDGRWMIAYTSEASATVNRIDCAIVNGSGGVLFSKQALTSGVFSEPDVDGDGTEFLTVFRSDDSFNGANVVGVRTTYGATLTHVPLALSFHELNSTLRLRDQMQPCVSRTKHGFTYAYMESVTPGATLFRIHAASIAVTAVPLVFAEQHVQLSSASGAFTPHICNGLLSNRSFVSSLRPGSADSIELAVFDQL